MGLDLDFQEGQTPLDEDEKSGLLISTITTRGELDEFEQKNIEVAIEWTLSQKFSVEEIFNEVFVRKLHRKMYGQVWKWAGEFRKTEKNIGVDPVRIGVTLKQLNDNALFWKNNCMFSEDEISIRYKHELVKIHCFINGNGRHSRLMADIIINKIFYLPVYSWGNSTLIKPGEARKFYLQSLKEADRGNIKPLIAFAKS